MKSPSLSAPLAPPNNVCQDTPRETLISHFCANLNPAISTLLFRCMCMRTNDTTHTTSESQHAISAMLRSQPPHQPHRSTLVRNSYSPYYFSNPLNSLQGEAYVLQGEFKHAKLCPHSPLYKSLNPHDQPFLYHSYS